MVLLSADPIKFSPIPSLARRGTPYVPEPIHRQRSVQDISCYSCIFPLAMEARRPKTQRMVKMTNAVFITTMNLG